MSDIQALASNRAQGQLHMSFGETGLVNLRETGGYRLKFPTKEHIQEAVIVNTAGGLVGGDSLDLDFTVLENAALTVTTTGAEKIYDAKDLQTSLSINLTVGVKSSFNWLPQETILFQGSNFKRDFNVMLEPTSELCLVEMLIFGRKAFGETIIHGYMQDTWRIYRQNQLIHAENTLFDDNFHDKLQEKAIGNGAHALATLIIAHDNLPQLLETMREKTYEGVDFACTLKSGLIIARFLSVDAYILRLALCEILGTIGITIPRLWK
jgi:urease accessory protein